MPQGRYVNLPDLVHYTDDQPGWTRKPSRAKNRAFNYYREDGSRITDALIRNRLDALAIPPAYTDVWICPLENGHLLSTGRDEAGRKQYRYHPDWMAFRQLNKFNKLVEFAEALPQARQTLRQIITDAGRGWSRERVAALAIALMDETGMRVGNRQYYKRNGTTGLTTLRRKHVDVGDAALHFEYRGKSHIDREVDVLDPTLVRLVTDVSELPGYEVFRYRDERGKMQNLDSADINDMVQQVLGPRFSSKYFRTWAATAAAVDFYWDLQEETKGDLPERTDLRVLERTSHYLGNTVDICRQYYVHPHVLAAIAQHRVPEPDSITKREEKRFGEWLDGEEIVAYRLCSQ